MKTKGAISYTASYFDNVILAILIVQANEDGIIKKNLSEIQDLTVKNAKGNFKQVISLNIDNSLKRLEEQKKIYKRWIEIPQDRNDPKCGENFFYAIDLNNIVRLPWLNRINF